jgi:hypothetical protein
MVMSCRRGCRESGMGQDIGKGRASPESPGTCGARYLTRLPEKIEDFIDFTLFCSKM